MKKAFKKSVSVLMIVVMCLSIAPIQEFIGFDSSSWFDFSVKASALAKTGQCGDSVYWNYNSSTGTLTISGVGPMYDYPYSAASPFWEGGMKSIIIEDGVTTVGDLSFRNCFNLINVSLPNSLTRIGKYAFCNSKVLTEIELPNSLTIIEKDAFTLCTALKKIYIPENVKKIEDHAFDDCLSLERFIVSSNNPYYCTDINGILYNKSRTELVKYPEGILEKKYVLPLSVTKILPSALHNDNIESLVLTKNLKSLEGWAICCYNIKELTMGNVENVGYYAFCSGCEKLKTVYFSGTKEQWDRIATDSDNYYLKQVVVNCNYIIKENEEHVGEIVPDGYDFYEDSYSFGNYTDSSLSKKYFTSLYSNANAEELFKSQKKSADGGLCCGFAYTTAAIYNDIPSANSIFKDPLIGSNTYINNLREATKSSKINIGKNTISISDYIKYAFVYQLSEDVLTQRNNTSFTSSIIQGYDYLHNENGIYDLYNLVKTVSSNNNMCVIIWLNGLNVPGLTNPGCHTVLCVGVEGNCILIDDSNLRSSNGFPDELGRLRINDDGTWVYEPYNGSFNSENTFISYALDYHKPYSILLTGNKVIADDYWIDDNNTGNCYVEGCEKLDTGKGILYCDSTDYLLNDIEKTEILDIGSGEINAEDTSKLYWVNSDDTITITNIKNDDNTAEFHFSSGNTIAELNVSDNSSITFNSDSSLNINSVINDEYTISYSYCFEDDNYKDKVVQLTISGKASTEVISAEKTEDGVEINGISDGTVILSKDDEVIETQEFKGAVSDIEITYDKNGIDNEVELDYHSHSYTSEITTPATHLAEGVETFTCACGDTYTKPVTKLTGHSYTSKVTSPATHLAEGVEIFTCACGDSYTKLVAKLTEHTYTSEVTKQPTHKEEGIKTFTCACGDSYTEAIAKTKEHSYFVLNIVEPTCESEGYTTYKCECGHTYNGDKKASTGHNYSCDTCVDCGESKIENCSCNCHKSGLMGIIWKILRFFYKLFKINPVCGCGVSHY